MINVWSSLSRSWIVDDKAKQKCLIVLTRKVDLTVNVRSSPSRSLISNGEVERRCPIIHTRRHIWRQIFYCPLVEVGSLTKKQNKDVWSFLLGGGSEGKYLILLNRSCIADDRVTLVNDCKKKKKMKRGRGILPFENIFGRQMRQF